MVIPGDAEVDEATVLGLVWGPASTYCKSRRAFLLIDAPKAWTQNNGRPAVTNNTDLINKLRVGLTTEYSAVFYPRLTYSNNGLIATIGASGAIAGLMARTDADRGVWKAPAGIEATLSGVLGLDVKLTDMENGVLNKKGVDCLRVFPSGLVNWGGRTLAGDDDFGSDWKYIPVRRLALMIEESLFRGTQWVVFEPNDEPLWAKIRLNVNAFMMSLFNQGAFQGTAPKDAFFVRCDSSTTTQNDRNLGIVNIQVGFAPLKPAEFVVITIQQIAGDL
jgi:phage tail sheath protein FI